MRPGVQHGLGVACAASLIICGAMALRRTATGGLALEVTQPSLPADGNSTTTLVIRSVDHRSLKDLRVAPDDLHRLRLDALDIRGDRATATFAAGTIPGVATVNVQLGQTAQARAQINLSLDDSDSFGDGTPDFLRLSDEADQHAFRRWFTFIAESQFVASSQPLEEVNDCAALLRFSYREALRTHNAQWGRALRLPPIGIDVADVAQYQFPFTPLGASIFRVRPGHFQAADLHDGAFAEFADANTLRRHSTFLVGRDIRTARAGDLLFYRQLNQHSPYHAMIFLGSSQFDPGEQAFVVYHTGDIGDHAGEIRRLKVADLLAYPDARWHPVPGNPAFLGVYRWNILRGAD